MIRKVYCNKQEINLTAKEYDILCLLVANKEQVLTYDQIYQKVWGEEAFGNVNNAIACHVHNLREKIGKLLPKAVLSFGVYEKLAIASKQIHSRLPGRWPVSVSQNADGFF